MFVRTTALYEELGAVYSPKAGKAENTRSSGRSEERLHVTVLLYSAFPQIALIWGDRMHQLITTFIPPIVSVGAFNKTLSNLQHLDVSF